MDSLRCHRSDTRPIRLLQNYAERMSSLVKGRRFLLLARCLGFPHRRTYRPRQKYGGMQPEMTKELKALQKENTRLKKMVAEQALDMEILKEAAKGNW